MRFIHISDLHIGKRLNEVNLIEDQRYILDSIFNIILENKADGVLIAGDVYDKGIPSAEAVELFDSFLSRLSERKIKVFIISGNHDSGTRLSFGNKILDKSDIYIEGEFSGSLKCVRLKDEFGNINVYMLPFVRPSNVTPYFDDIVTYNDAVSRIISTTHLNPLDRNIILSHQFVTGRMEKPETSDSEILSVGGTDEVYYENYINFDYVALGHIHKCQRIGKDEIMYAGSPLKYSFSEVMHTKSVILLDLKEKGNVIITRIPLTPLHDMREIKGELDALIDKAVFGDESKDDYIKAVLADTDILAEPMARLRQVYKNVLVLEYEKFKRNLENKNKAVNIEDISKDPNELFSEFYKNMTDREMTKLQEDIVKDIFFELSSGGAQNETK